MKRIRLNQKHLLQSTFWIFLLVFMVHSCRQPAEVQEDSLYGRWDIARAERNGKETGYLRNGYFIILPDGSMTVNLTGEDEKGMYVLDNNKLIMADDKVFLIRALKNDSLTIDYDSGSSDFVFYMTKKSEDAQ